MVLLVALLAQALAPPVVSPGPPLIAPRQVFAQPGAADGDAFDFNDPPIEMIDFLGRRYECAHRGIPTAERRRLRCAALPGEERALRARFANDADALRWLDQAPLEFRMEPRVAMTLDHTEPTLPHRIEQSGVDETGRAYRLTIDTMGDGGRLTRIAVAYDGWPERSFALSNRSFPLLDMETLQVRILPVPNDRRFHVRVRYGCPRDYCGEIGETDNRPQVQISFERGRVRGSDGRRDNCQHVYVPIVDAGAR
ncbi:MAG TPA: hypothetical protein VEC11_13770 [Allosphingosinicella sp.]|nr:hypothetical protein [Allosphingosinicella sp.]